MGCPLTLEAKGDQVVGLMRHIPGIEDLGLFRVVGQPNLEVNVDRAQAARFQINVADVQDAVQTAITLQSLFLAQGGTTSTTGTGTLGAAKPAGFGRAHSGGLSIEPRRHHPDPQFQGRGDGDRSRR